MKDKVFFVIDMKCFYACVECKERNLDPFKTNLVVADAEKGSGTICLAISPAMKNLGVKNRCRIYQIPDEIKFISAKPQMKKYIEYSSEVYGVYLKHFDKEDVFPYSIDEMFIDVTSYLKLYKISKEELAQKLVNEIHDKVGIPCAVGMGSNMFLAKVALDILAKKSKNSMAYLDEKLFREKLWTHTPITDFWQISHGTEKRLLKHGITNMKEITKIDEKILFNEFGVDAEFLIDHAWGKEPCLIKDIKEYKTQSKSISSSHVLPKDYTKTQTKTVLYEMIYEMCLNLLKNHLSTNHISISIRYSYKNQASFKMSKKLQTLTNSYEILSKIIADIFEKNVNENFLIRKISFSFSNLQSENYECYDFLTDLKAVEKEKKFNKAVIDVKGKFGKNAIVKGISLTKEGRQKERNATIGGHNE